tara:strand:- start:135 stop:338 length:204 start_codon:yes stop_codon:yes gene_type:complete
METIEKILETQNLLLLKQIADDKFNNEEDKQNFIDKYNKINYKKFKITKNNIVYNYDKNLNAFYKKI